MSADAAGCLYFCYHNIRTTFEVFKYLGKFLEGDKIL